MRGTSPNFDFLAEGQQRLLRLAVLAERYSVEDAPGALVKLLSFAELMAKPKRGRRAAAPGHAGA